MKFDIAEARRGLAISSWTVVGFVVVGAVASIPAISEVLTDAPEGSFLYWEGKVVAAAAGLSRLALWGAALWHASLEPPSREFPRGLLFALLIFGNAVAALFYYFLYVPGRRSPGRLPASDPLLPTIRASRAEAAFHRPRAPWEPRPGGRERS